MSSYAEQWADALADGSGMDPIPTGWISLRDLEKQTGQKYEFLTGLDNREKFCMVYDKDFMLHISPDKADKLLGRESEPKQDQPAPADAPAKKKTCWLWAMLVALMAFLRKLISRR